MWHFLIIVSCLFRRLQGASSRTLAPFYHSPSEVTLISLPYHWDVLNSEPVQQAHNLKTASNQRRCDAMTSHRRRYNVVLTSGVYWVCHLTLEKNEQQLSATKWCSNVHVSINSITELFNRPRSSLIFFL